MTALQLNAELFRELSIIAEDESLMQKAVKYLKKLSAKKVDIVTGATISSNAVKKNVELGVKYYNEHK